MNLADALNSARSPITKSIFLVVSAVDGAEAGEGRLWAPCNQDRSSAVSIMSTAGWLALCKDHEEPTVVEACYGNGAGGFLTVKCVPMDDTYLVMIVQRGDGENLPAPISTTFSIKEEPLVSLLGAYIAGDDTTTPSKWNSVSAEQAVQSLRCSLSRSIACASQAHGSEKTSSVVAPVEVEKRESVLPQSVQSGIPECGPAFSPPTGVTGSSALFAGLVPRPVGFRYGERDLLPDGGSGIGVGGGMALGSDAFRGANVPYARRDPIFPGDRPRGGHFSCPKAPLLPGEPDPDHLIPPGGLAFSSCFGPGRGTNFGPPFPR
uniref:Uncharacterized protein TCIL3000_11_10620 n=1 Tax=Trypanosoma congolense (strain IL3000) TaxID=1068625 RepID=G0V1R8_TRYCI|nr:unnamed protein product [Trypanosoma congolense IL3000]